MIELKNKIIHHKRFYKIDFQIIYKSARTIDRVLTSTKYLLKDVNNG